MNREEYLRALASELRRMPKEEYERAMAYYVEFFDEAGPESEAEVIADLGTPKEVAAEIIADTAIKRMDDPEKIAKKPFSSIWSVILAICAAPIALPVTIVLIIAVGMLALGVLMAVVMVLVTEVVFCASGLIAAVIGFVLMFSQPATGITNMGLGLTVLGVGVFGGFVVTGLLKWMGKGVRALFSKIIRKGRAK